MLFYWGFHGFENWNRASLLFSASVRGVRVGHVRPSFWGLLGSWLGEVVAVKHARRTWDEAASLAMHGLPDEGAWAINQAMH